MHPLVHSVADEYDPLLRIPDSEFIRGVARGVVDDEAEILAAFTGKDMLAVIGPVCYLVFWCLYVKKPTERVCRQSVLLVYKGLVV